MPLGPNNQETPELFEFLLNQFTESQMGMAGEEPEPSQLQKMFDTMGAPEQRGAAEALNTFLAFCRQFMLDHPPQTHIMLSEGFGVQLAGGYNVALTPQTQAEAEGDMQDAGDIAVTTGKTMRNMHGVQPSNAIDITGQPGQ